MTFLRASSVMSHFLKFGLNVAFNFLGVNARNGCNNSPFKLPSHGRLS